MIFGYNIRKLNVKDIQSTTSCEGGLMDDSAWSMFQHDVRHTGRSSYGKSGTWRNLKWKFKMDSIILSSPVIGKDRTIYIGGANKFYSINPEGSLKWTYTIGWDRVESAAAIDKNGTIYFGTLWGEPNYLYALNPNGTLKWRYKSGQMYYSPITDNDGTIYFGDTTNYITALKSNGSVRWKFITGDDIETTPAIGEDGTIYCGSRDKYIYALYPNGTLKWKYKVGCWMSDPTIADDGTIYFSGVQAGALYALYSNGTKKWKLTLGDSIISSPALAEDSTIYIAADKSGWGAYIYSIYPNGTIIWKYEVGDEGICSSPAIDKYGIVYIGGRGGYRYGDLYAFNPNGTRKWKYKTEDAIFSSAAIGEDGTIYIGSWDEYLYAIEPVDDEPPKKPDIDGPVSGKIGIGYNFTAKTTDPDGENISYFFDWDDGTNSGWTDFVPSGTSVSWLHGWWEKGAYTVRVKAKGEKYGRESEWGELTIIFPRDKSTSSSPLLRFLERYPLLQTLLLRLGLQ